MREVSTSAFAFSLRSTSLHTESHESAIIAASRSWMNYFSSSRLDFARADDLALRSA